VNLTPDEILAELNDIRSRLAELPPGVAARAELEERRAELHAAAQYAADATRDPRQLQRELEHLEGRLAAIEDEKIEVPSWQQAMAAGHLTINDPGAPNLRINQALDAASALDRAAIEARIARLKKALHR
jgi:hypothetical protein